MKKISEIVEVSSILQYRSEGLSYIEIGKIYGVTSRRLIQYIKRAGITNTKENLSAKLQLIGYSKEESKIAMNKYKKDSTIDLLDYLPCKCKDGFLCLPHRLNLLRQKHSVKNLT